MAPIVADRIVPDGYQVRVRSDRVDHALTEEVSLHPAVRAAAYHLERTKVSFRGPFDMGSVGAATSSLSSLTANLMAVTKGLAPAF